jgi:peptide/nickel transport system permease protein
MLSFFLSRAWHGLVVMLLIGIAAFFLFRFVGDPVSVMVSQSDTIEVRAQLRADLGLDDPVIVQFGRFLWKAAQGDFGISYTYREPVERLIGERLPASIELVFCSAVLALALGLPLGIYTALRPHGLLSRALQVVSLVGISVPAFLLGITLIMIFSVSFHVLPSFGRGGVTKIGWWTTGLLTIDGVKALIMPALTLGLFQMTLIMRLVRTEMLGVLRSDFIRFARARGLPEWRLNFRHALKSTLVPVITVTGIQVGSLIAFGVVTETVFQWPGLGLLLIQAVNSVDVPILAAYLTQMGFLFVVINLVVDLLCLVVNPRLRINVQ